MVMRLTSLALWLGASAVAVAQSEEDLDGDAKPTLFNGKTVPPLAELGQDGFEKDTKASQYALVKFFQPWCQHCQDFAPTYQTLYEYYTTSFAPHESSERYSKVIVSSFDKYYDFKFYSVNCEAYGDLCTKQRVTSYPMVALYKRGVRVTDVHGAKPMSAVAKMIEDELEESYPGTRPKEIKLPDTGDSSFPKDVTSTTSTSKEGEKEQEKEKDTIKDTTQKKLPSDETDTSTTTTSTAVSTATDDASKSQKSQATDDSNSMHKVDKVKFPWVYDFPDPARELKRPKPSTTPNENGLSTALTAESFQSLVTMTQDPWFIKFYAPWCHHCQAMAASWLQMAKEMQGRLNIGEVNCDAEPRLCKDVHVRGYPTVHFFKGGERVEYDGLRGLGDFLKYAEKALDICDGVQDVDSESLRALERKEDVVFVYFYDHATTVEDMMALERLPLSLIGRAKIVKTRDPELYQRFKITTWPRLLVSRDGRPTYYTPLMPSQMRDTNQVLNWMKSVWLPIIPELTASNAREIMDGKIVVLGILNRKDQEAYTGAIREMKSAANEWMDKQIHLFQQERQELRDAKQLRIEEAEDRNDQRALRAAKTIRINMDMSDRKEVTFAWVDGVFWQRWIRTTYGIDVKDGERVIINDEDNRRYWDVTTTGNYIIPSRTSILETISKVVASPPKIKPKLTISSFEKVLFDIRVTFIEHPILSIGCIAGIALGVYTVFRGRNRRYRGTFQPESTLPLKEVRDGLMGTTANGKKD